MRNLAYAGIATVCLILAIWFVSRLLAAPLLNERDVER